MYRQGPSPEWFVRSCLLLLAAVFTHHTATARAAAIEFAELTRADQTLDIHWKSSAPVDVYVATQANAPAAQRKRVSHADSDGVHRMPVAAGERPYVWLVPKDGPGQWVAERVLPLQGGRNFRDMGGYQTTDGKRVVWGQIFRSGTMANLTDGDYTLLGKLGIAVVCDLRSPQEREFEPTQWSRINPAMKYLAWDQPMSAADTDKDGKARPGALARGPIIDPAVAREAFKDNYRHGAYTFADQYRRIFGQLADGKGPLVVNCSAGKDRTGRIAALLLTALGVPRATVVADYAMSDDLVDFEAAFAKRSASAEAGQKKKKDSPYKMMEQWSPEARAVLLSSDPEFIEAMFEQIETDYGSVRNFLAKELGVDDAKLARLKARYLEY